MKKIFVSLTLLVALTAAACSKNGSTLAPATTPEEAMTRAEFNFARNDQGQVLLWVAGNPQVALEDRDFEYPDSPVTLIARNWACVEPDDPDVSSAFKDWYTDFGNGRRGHLETAVTRWGPIKSCNDRFEIQFLLVTKDRGPENPYYFDKMSNRFIIIPAGAGSVERAKAYPLARVVAGTISRLPLASQTMQTMHAQQAGVHLQLQLRYEGSVEK